MRLVRSEREHPRTTSRGRSSSRSRFMSESPRWCLDQAGHAGGEEEISCRDPDEDRCRSFRLPWRIGGDVLEPAAAPASDGLDVDVEARAVAGEGSQRPY